MIALLLSLLASAAPPDPFQCAEAAFRVAASRAALTRPDLDEAARAAAEQGAARAEKVQARCGRPAVPASCAVEVAALAADEARAHAAMLAAAAPLGELRTLPTLATQRAELHAMRARVEAVEHALEERAADTDVDTDTDAHAPPDPELLASQKRQAEADLAAVEAAWSKRAAAEGVLREAEAAWLAASAPLNRARCAAAACAAQAGAPADPACPGKAHGGSDKVLAGLRDLHADLARDDAGFTDAWGPTALAERLRAADAAGATEITTEARAAWITTLVVDSSRRPTTGRARLAAALAHLDGVQRLSPVELLWGRAVLAWGDQRAAMIEAQEDDLAQLLKRLAEAGTATAPSDPGTALRMSQAQRALVGHDAGDPPSEDSYR